MNGQMTDVTDQMTDVTDQMTDVTDQLIEVTGQMTAAGAGQNAPKTANELMVVSNNEKEKNCPPPKNKI